MRGLGLIAFALLILWPEAAGAQGYGDARTVQRGRAADTDSFLDARRLVDELGASCEVTDARLMGRGVDGQPQYEARCRDGPGLILVAGARRQAVSCLALEAQHARPGADRQAPRCRLPGARDATPVVAAIARRAGLECAIDGARLVGRNAAGGDIYEVGCRDEIGGWLFSDGPDWTFKDCLVVQVEGGDCVATSRQEALATVEGWLGVVGRPGCRPDRAEYRGRSEDVSVYEVRCADGSGLMLRRPDAGAAETVACADARKIGGGCRLDAQGAQHGDPAA